MESTRKRKAVANPAKWTPEAVNELLMAIGGEPENFELTSGNAAFFDISRAVEFLQEIGLEYDRIEAAESSLNLCYDSDLMGHFTDDPCENAYRLFYCATLRGLSFGISSEIFYNQMRKNATHTEVLHDDVKKDMYDERDEETNVTTTDGNSSISTHHTIRTTIIHTGETAAMNETIQNEVKDVTETHPLQTISSATTPPFIELTPTEQAAINIVT